MSTATFEPQYNSDLLKPYQCVVIDLPGHGNSDRLKSYSIQKIVAILYNELQYYNNLILVGHSLGGQLAIHLIEKLSENCKGIIICSTPPIDPQRELTEIYNINEISLSLLKDELNKDAIASLSNFLYPHQTKWSHKLKDLIKNTDPKFRTGYAASLNNLDLNDETQILREFPEKKLLIAGENDALLKLEYLKEVSDLINVPLKTIEKCGHFPQLEKPEVFNQIILEFIKSVEE